MGTTADAARRAVPEVTTSRMNFPMVAATSGLTIVLNSAVRPLPSSRIHWPDGIIPPFATVAATRAI